MTEPSSEAQELFLRSPDERERRRRQKLGSLPIRFASTLRGTKRGGNFEFSPVPPVEPLPAGVIKELSGRVRKAKVLDGPFTKGYNPKPTRGDIDAYTMGGNKNNKRQASTPEERAEIIAARKRQSFHIGDSLQAQDRKRMHTADIRRGAINHVTRAVRRGVAPAEEAAIWASDALEDLGISLRDKPDLIEGLGSGTDLAFTIEHIGAYTTEHPEVFADHLPLLEVALIEQEKRYRQWGKLYVTDQRTGLDRRTVQDREEDEAVRALVRSFRQLPQSEQQAS